MEKTIIDKLVGEIDIGPILPIIQTIQFQKLGFRKQLGATHLAFRNANHTRFEHSIGVYQRTLKRAEDWLKKGIISRQAVTDITNFALVHDIGHGPFSHLIEPICSQNHEQYGALLIREISSAIELCDSDPQNILDLFEKRNPLALAVLDKNLGTDKLDYLTRDAFYASYGFPEISRLARATTFHKNNLVVSEKMIDEAKEFQRFYLLMYKKVYLGKSSLIIQRFLQRMIQRLFSASELKEADLWPLTDEELIAVFISSLDPIIQRAWQNFKSRRFPKTLVSFRLNGFGREEKSGGDDIKVIEIDQEEMKKIELLGPHLICQLENLLARIADIPPNAFLIVPVTTPERFIPKDIIILANKKVYSLFKEYKKHLSELQEMANSYVSFKVCVDDEYREPALKITKEIKEIIFNFPSAL